MGKNQKKKSKTALAVTKPKASFAKMDDNEKSVILFVLFTFGIAWFVLLIAFLCGYRYTSVSPWVLNIMMLAPLAGNLLTRTITGEGYGHLRIKPKFKHNILKLITVYILPALLVLSGMVLYFLFVNPDALDVNATNSVNSIAANYGLDFETARGTFYGQIMGSFAIAPLAYIVFALASEFGWRGFLLQKLANQYGLMKASLYTNVIWGVWYIPLILMGYNYGTDYPYYPLTGIGLNIMFCLAVGTISSYYTLRLDSVIPAALFFSGVYSLSSYGIYFLNSENVTIQEMLIIGPSATGIAGMSVLILAALMYLLRFRRMDWDEFDEVVSNVRGEARRKRRNDD